MAYTPSGTSKTWQGKKILFRGGDLMPLRKQIQRRLLIEDGKLTGFLMDGQPYRFLGTRFYKSETTGNVVELADFEAPCRECGEPFVASGKFEDGFLMSVVRRCRSCALKNPKNKKSEEAA